MVLCQMYDLLPNCKCQKCHSLPKLQKCHLVPNIRKINTKNAIPCQKHTIPRFNTKTVLSWQTERIGDLHKKIT